MSQINSNTKDDFQVVLLLSCFVGHPVFKSAVHKPALAHLNKYKFNNFYMKLLKTHFFTYVNYSFEL